MSGRLPTYGKAGGIVTADDLPSPGSTVVTCGQCGESYQQAGRGNGGWFHFMVVAMNRRPDGSTQVTGHRRVGDWIEGATLVLRTRGGRRLTIVGAQVEPPLNSVCEARGQRSLIVVLGLGPIEPGCFHAVR